MANGLELPGSSVTWTVTGRTLGGGDAANNRIDITQINRSFSMGEGQNPYGLPVDAPLAVQLIRNFWKRLEKEVPDEKSWIRSLLKQSLGMSLDKSILLKILSQPKCEGIRFYLCLKEGSSGLPANPDLLSLVAVGVDAGGKDLLYAYDPKVHESGIENLKTTSLLAEYGHPPGLVEEPSSSTSIDPFVLFKYSE